MARIDEVKREKLTTRQQQLHDHFLRSRPAAGNFSGPFSVLIHTPGLAEPVDSIVNYFRGSQKLERRLVELIILMLCREANVKYAWSVHEPTGLKEGLTQETIDAIRARKRPGFKHDDEALIYDFVTELLATKTVSTAMFERAKAALGLEGMIEAVTCAGCYSMIGLVLNVFDIPPRAGVPLA